MFLDFYGFREQPFGVTPDPRFLYLSPMHREALASLYYGIEAGRGFLSMIARPGMGKTTLLFQLLEEFRNAARTAFLFQTQCDSREFIRFLLAELGIESKEQDRVKMHEEFNAVLLREMKAGKRFVVVIDEAQNLDDSVLETVRLLSNFETPRAKLMQIILSGQPELADKLARPNLSQLRQRISIVARLEPLSPQHIHDYIAHRLRVAGYTGPQLFLPGAEAAIMERSEGIPRTVNNLCFNALSLGYALGKRQIERAMVDEISLDLDLDNIANRPRAPQFSIPFNSPIFTPTSSWLATEADRMQASDIKASAPAVATATSCEVSAESAVTDAELNSLVAELNANVTNHQQPETTKSEPVSAVATAAQPAQESQPAAMSEPALRPTPIFTQPAHPTPPSTRPAPPAAGKAFIVARNQSSPSRFKKWAKPLIFAVLAVDVALGAIFIMRERGASPSEVKAASSSMFAPVTNDDTALVSEDNIPRKTGIGLRISVPASVMRDNLVRMVPPTTPRNGGSDPQSVMLQAIVGRDGTVRSARALSGDPEFAKAATQAVMQWKYKPYLVNGEPADVDTQITVNFNSANNRSSR